MNRCPRDHLLVAITTDHGEELVHVFEADAEECAALDQLENPKAGGMIGRRSDKDT